MCYESQDSRNYYAIKEGLCSFTLAVLMFFVLMILFTVFGY